MMCDSASRKSIDEKKNFVSRKWLPYHTHHGKYTHAHVTIFQNNKNACCVCCGNLFLFVTNIGAMSVLPLGENHEISLPCCGHTTCVGHTNTPCCTNARLFTIMTQQSPHHFIGIDLEMLGSCNKHQRAGRKYIHKPCCG